ncbi:MAG: oligoendopeptidase F [Gammaproteobacteria bacterium]|nr:oligoendopeptidase F [Gammaproteobacteria bacterium]
MVVALVSTPTSFAKQDYKSSDERQTWDLTQIYKTSADWDKARKEVLEDIKKIERRKGMLGDSANTLYTTLQMVSDLTRKGLRVYVYSSLKADENLGDTQAQERRQLSIAMFSQFQQATSWVQPETLTVGRKRIEKFIEQDERLAPFIMQLDNSLRNKPHTLTEEAEKALSYFGQSNGAPNEIYSLLANTDIPWPEVELSNGEKARIDSQGYSKWRASDNRDDRKKVFDAYWTRWGEYSSTIGRVLSAHIQTQVAAAKARNYDSVLQRELFGDNLPVEVYKSLVSEVNKALPTLHRYFKLRSKMLGVEQMHYYDIYPPLVSMDKTFDFESSNRITLEAMAILGDDWVSIQTQAVSERWVHVKPQKGKRSGAYMQPGAYDVHPYLLLNHNDDYQSLSTLAHEWGHAMHSIYAKQTQPYETSNYAIFIAEIPSTSLELILQDYMTKNTKDIDEKIYYLGSALEGMRATFFRQTMFAEFELNLYEAVERGEALTGEKISKMYGEILKRYHGHDEGIVQIDDLYSNEWMFIPHFYYNMYVFQYATSKTAGTALYAKMLDEGKVGVENFKDLLRAGSSDYPYVLLKDAGVDLAKPEPYQAIVKKMNQTMDEIEALLEQRAK